MPTSGGSARLVRGKRPPNARTVNAQAFRTPATIVAMRSRFVAFALALSTAVIAAPSAGAQTAGLQKLNHIVVIYQENWSFDSLYGKFPGANGFDQAGPTTPQVDKDGKPYTTLPQPLNTLFSPAVPDPRFPADLPVAPIDTSKYVGPNQQPGDLVHRYYQP